MTKNIKTNILAAVLCIYASIKFHSDGQDLWHWPLITLVWALIAAYYQKKYDKLAGLAWKSHSAK